MCVDVCVYDSVCGCADARGCACGCGRVRFGCVYGYMVVSAWIWQVIYWFSVDRRMSVVSVWSCVIAAQFPTLFGFRMDSYWSGMCMGVEVCV